ncbi:MAG TPA: peptide chain release factor N(5)-glutamine methyltransferase [Gemmatimonadales bacterium]|nr:peptide chain release factor N(5)-glutamine methyltransferase [Gemmatimonadales bacterium]
MSRGRLIAEAAATLTNAELGAARQEAMRLWREVTGDLSGAYLLESGAPVSPHCAAAYTEAIRRRAAGEPFAHVTGYAGFRHLTLRSDRRALIPRPETEGLVELVLARVPAGRVADVGTGSGCIALSLATEGSYDAVVGVDCSTDALNLAAENRALSGARVALVRGDLCQPLRGGSFDAVVSNPPYLTAGEYAALDPAVREWEPRGALEAGDDGLDAIARLLDVGMAVVRPGGWLALEVDCARAAVCASRAGASGWTDVAIHQDLFGRERYLLARRSDFL